MSTLYAALRRTLVVSCLAGLGLGLLVTPSPAAEVESSGSCPDGVVADPRRVEVLPLRGGFIDPPVVDEVTDVIALAESHGSELIVLQYSSRGGVSSDIDVLVDRIEASSVPVAVLVGPLGTGARAEGAAGMLWAAADVRAVALDASVGPVRPVDLALGADGVDEFAMLSRLLPGADAAMVERLLDTRVPAADLVEAGLVTVEAAGLEPLLLELDGTNVSPAGQERTLQLRACEVEVRFHTMGLVRRMLHAATTGPFVYLLLVAGIGMLLFELFQPGFGVAGIAGVVTGAIGVFGLTVLPVTWWAVALVVLGLLLYAVDTAIAGFGPVTLAATVALVVGSLRFYAADQLALDPWLVAGTTLTAFVFFVFVMTSLLRAQAGPDGVSMEDLVGRPGIVRSVLSPEGHVFIDGALWRARWTGESRRAKVGTPVRVHAVEGAVVLVEPFDPQQVSSAPTGSTEVSTTD